MDADLPYEESTDLSYGELAAQTFTVCVDSRETFLLSGPCPRCKGIFEAAIVGGIFEGSRSVASSGVGQPGQAIDRIEPMVCSCRHLHPGVPDAGFGCGAYWNVILSVDVS